VKPLILFGAGSIADVIESYLARQGQAPQIAAHAVDRDFLSASDHKGRPVVTLEDLPERFPPENFAAFVAVGYQQMNAVRATRIEQLAARGYDLPNIVDPSAFVSEEAQLGRNLLILDGASVEPFARLDDGCFVWSNAVVGHHSRLGKAVWVTAGAGIGGDSALGDRCFLGLNATVGNRAQLGKACFLGANALVTKSSGDSRVFVLPDTPAHRLDTDMFLKITQLT